MIGDIVSQISWVTESWNVTANKGVTYIFIYIIIVVVTLCCGYTYIYFKFSLINDLSKFWIYKMCLSLLSLSSIFENFSPTSCLHKKCVYGCALTRNRSTQAALFTEQRFSLEIKKIIVLLLSLILFSIIFN